MPTTSMASMPAPGPDVLPTGGNSGAGSRSVPPRKSAGRARRGEWLLDTQALAQSLYRDLRSLAAAVLADEWAAHSLQPTALAHEAFVKLVTNAGGERWETPGHFLAAAGQAMRRVLVDAARRRRARKRVACRCPEDVSALGIAVVDVDAEVVLVDDALDALAAENPSAADVVRLRYFGGFTVPEIAGLLGMPIRTVERRWTYARAWLGSRFLDTRDP